jgi:hypothetical protein
MHSYRMLFASQRTQGAEWPIQMLFRLSSWGAGVFIGLWLNSRDGDSHIMRSGFDGFYTYFSSDAASYASHPANWLALCR